MFLMAVSTMFANIGGLGAVDENGVINSELNTNYINVKQKIDKNKQSNFPLFAQQIEDKDYHLFDVDVESRKIEISNKISDTDKKPFYYNARKEAAGTIIQDITSDFVVKLPKYLIDFAQKKVRQGENPKQQTFKGIPEKQPKDSFNYTSLAKNIEDIRTGVGITSPISLTYYQNNNSAMHPGSTRLLLCNIYEKKIPVVITDFSNTFASKFQHLEILLPKNAYIENIHKMRFAIDNTGLADSPKAHREVCPYPVTIKELTDHCDFYAKPTKAEPPVLYYIKDKKLYVDNNCFANYNKKKWSLFI
jgi:hypothetical protein